MSEFLATIILIGSLLGMVMMVLRKTPVLEELPPMPRRMGPSFFFLGKKFVRFRKKSLVSSFSLKILLQRFLSKLKILALKIETRTEKYLQKLREESRREKQNLSDNYWQKLKQEKKNFSKKSF